jgi:hypothetical protein
MHQDPAPLPFLQEALTIAKFEPGVYAGVRTFTPAGEPNSSDYGFVRFAPEAVLPSICVSAKLPG